MRHVFFTLAITSLVLTSCDVNDEDLLTDAGNDLPEMAFAQEETFENLNTPYNVDGRLNIKPKGTNTKNPPGSGWNLVWSDNFNRNSVGSDWNTDYKYRGWKGGYELSWNQNSSDVDCNGSAMVIRIREVNNQLLTSGRADTKGLSSWKYCYIEARMHMPEPHGFQGAFWMMPNAGNGMVGGNIQDNNTASDGAEIDIVEANKSNNKYTTNIHRDGYGNKTESNSAVVGAPGLHSNWWSVFGLNWDSSKYEFYYNGTLKRTVSSSSWISDVNQYAILSAGIFPDGNWAGSLDLNEMPAFVYADWIKVWK